MLALILGVPKGWLPPKLDEPDAIEAEAVEVPNKSEERSLTLAGKPKELPADLDSDTNRERDLENRERDLEKRTESEAGKLDEELQNLNRQLTDESSRAGLMRPVEQAPLENALKGFRKLNSNKPDCPSR